MRGLGISVRDSPINQRTKAGERSSDLGQRKSRGSGEAAGGYLQLHFAFVAVCCHSVLQQSVRAPEDVHVDSCAEELQGLIIPSLSYSQLQAGLDCCESQLVS